MEARQSPTFSANLPEDMAGDGPMAARLASAYFGEPLDWQRKALDIMLARGTADKYKVRTFGLAVPRQNGKSWNIRARSFYGAVVGGEKILYTCQHGDTSDEMFKDLSAPFDDESEVELRSLLKSVRKTNGQQAIYLTNGGIIRFTTRTNSLARGKTYDVLIYDEAQELTKSQQEASLPTISASSKHNAQVIYIGTPPGPESPGTVFREMHDRVHAGTSGAAWLEWSVSEIGDVSDRSRWYEANPSLGFLVDETAVEGELASMSPDGFARERLGWWSPLAQGEHPIDAAAWGKCLVGEDEVPPDSSLTCYGVKFSPDGSRGALAVCLKPKEGAPFVEVVDAFSMGSGTQWLADWLCERRARCAQVTIDGASNAGNLVDKLASAHFPRRAMLRSGTKQLASACSGLANAVAEGTLAHRGQPGLTAAVTGCTKRMMTKDGAWGFDGDGASADPTLVEAVALALWGAQVTRRKPGRGSRVL